MDKTRGTGSRRGHLKFAFIGLGGVVALWLAFGALALNADGVLCWLGYDAASTIEPGTFGDMFGAGNAFFSALAFAAVAYTLWLQLQELEEARLDRREAREDSKENIKLQGEIAAMQFKVAQSGDVYAAFASVAGNEFMTRIQRLRWLAKVFEETSSPGLMPTGLAMMDRTGVMKLLYWNQGEAIPQYYAHQINVGGISAEPHEDFRESADRVIQDAIFCVDALIDLRPALLLGLFDEAILSSTLRQEDCAFLAAFSRGVNKFYQDEPAFLEELAELLASAHATSPTTPEHSTPT